MNRKRVILALVSFGILLVVYWVYSWTLGQPPPTPKVRETINKPKPPDKGVKILGLGKVGEAKKTWSRWTDPKTGRVLREFSSDRAIPKPGDRFAFENPHIRIYPGREEVIIIRADHGLFQIKHVGSARTQPRQGRLWGNVRLTIRRREDPEPIRAWIEEVNYDDELSRITTDKPVVIYSTRLDVRGKGLLVTWDELSRRLKEFRIGSDVVMNLRGAGRQFASVGLSPDDKKAKPPPEKKLATPRKIRVYQANFDSRVTVRQPERCLTADRLKLTFEVKEKDSSGKKPSEPERPEKPAPPRAIDKDEKTVRITCAGGMNLVSLPKEAPSPDGSRFDVIAVGKPVKIEEGADRILCGKLTFNSRADQVLLDPADHQKVSLTDEQGRRLETDSLTYSRRRDAARLDGPGTLFDPQGNKGTKAKPAPVSLAWKQGGQIQFNRSDKGRMRLSSATFYGKIALRHPDAKLRAKILTAQFSPKGKTTVLSKVRATQGVRLDAKRDVFAARAMELTLVEDKKGRRAPSVLNAWGKVVARRVARGRRSTASADRMKVVFSAKPDGRTAPKRIHGWGQVSIRDEQPNRAPVMIAGDEFLRDLETGSALVHGNPAMVARGKEVLTGPTIAYSEKNTQLDVPGRGRADFLLSEDLTGSAGKDADKEFMRVDWTRQLQFNQKQNLLTVTGDVIAQSRSRSLECAQFQLHLTQGEKAGSTTQEPPSGADSSMLGAWDLGRRAIHRTEAVGKVRAEFREIEKKGPPRKAGTENAPLRRRTIWTERLIFDAEARRLVSPVAGRAVLIDHRTAAKKPKPLKNSGMLNRTRRGPSHTLLEWSERMDLSPRERTIELRGDVAFVYQPVIMDRQRETFQPSGDPAAFRSDVLRVTFMPRSKESPTGEGSMAGSKIKTLHAKGNVYLRDGTLQVFADRIDFSAEKDRLIARGGTNGLARILMEDPQTGVMRRYERAIIEVEGLSGDAPTLRARGRGGLEMTAP